MKMAQLRFIVVDVEKGVNQIILPKLKRWVGSEQRVLVDSQLDFGVYRCRHFGQAHEVDSATILASEKATVGDWVTVRITGAKGYDLVAVEA